MRFFVVLQMLALMAPVLVEPLTHAIGLSSNHSHTGEIAHVLDQADHAALCDHSPSQDQGQDRHQPSHCHFAFFTVSAAPVLYVPYEGHAFGVTRASTPVAHTLSPPTRPPLAA